MRLETSDFAGLSGLSNCVYGHSDASLRFDRLELLVQSDEHARVHRKRQVIQEVMVFAADKGTHVRACVDGGQQSS